MWHKVAAISGILFVLALLAVFLDRSELSLPLFSAGSGVAAIGLGTYGAHGFRPKNPSYNEVRAAISVFSFLRIDQKIFGAFP